jgi:hypothetical protein
VHGYEESDDDYEYELDEQRTESYYFTLDLSSHDDRAASKADHGQGGVPGQLQILDLHTENPLVKLDEKFYSCNWSTDLGTQVYVARSGVAQEPQRPGHVVDVVGLSRTRLVGQPAILHQRQRDNDAPVEGVTAENAIPVEKDRGHFLEDATDAANAAPTTARQVARFAAVREKATDPAQKAQASFLERLSSIKQKRGESDIVPFYGIKKYKAPANKNEIRQVAIRASAEEGRPSFGRSKKLKRPPKKSKRKTSTNETEVLETPRASNEQQIPDENGFAPGDPCPTAWPPPDPPP